MSHFRGYFRSVRTGFVERMDGWASARINLFADFNSKYLRQCLSNTWARSVQIISERKQMECESNVKISLRIRLSTGNGKQFMHGF